MKLSVIVPGFNTPDRWWTRCLKSVLEALPADAEILCVDDGSRDRPSIQISDARIKWVFLPENQGLARARNAALAIAEGEFVTFIDSDDEIYGETFRRCLHELQETGTDIAIYGVRCVWPEDGLMKDDGLTHAPTLVDGRIGPRDVLWLHRQNLLNYSCNKVYRRSFLVQANLSFMPEGMPYEDIIFNLGCLRAGARYCYVDYIGYVYYRTRGTLLSRYKSTLCPGAGAASEAWTRYKEETPGAWECLGNLGEVSQSQLQNRAWRNCWMPGSPVSLGDRWKMRPGLAFFKMACFVLLRRYAYFRFVRRWNTCRNYPHARNWREE